MAAASFPGGAGGIELDASVLEQLRTEASDYACTRGMVMNIGGSVQHAPMTLLPMPFPRAAFEQVQEVATDFNLLVHRISLDSEFILTSLAATENVDPFTTSLLRIYRQVLAEGQAQPLVLGLHRSDYMLHAPPTVGAAAAELRQVEINTISASFSNLGSIVCDLHHFVLAKIPELARHYDASALPRNEALVAMPAGLAEAWRLYGHTDRRDTVVVMMIVQPGERNAFDQRHTEYTLWNSHKIRLIRRTMCEIGQRATLHDTSRALLIDGYEVAVAYYRAGYTPNDYPTDVEWAARLLVERSLAIKCPNIAYHLAGTKKVQQVLDAPGLVERFLPDGESAARVRRTFAGLWSLGGDSDAAVVERALANPHGYVLKPQREGGGNNLYEEDLARELRKMDAQERGAFILMERILPPSPTTYIMRDQKIVQCAGVSELGIFGIFIGNKETVHVNKVGGQLLRTKPAHQDDGGVAAGVAVLDSLYLVPSL